LTKLVEPLCMMKKVVLKKIIKYYTKGWPKTKHQVKNEVCHYWNIRNEILIESGVVYYQNTK